jgi:hypothetical protein
MRTTNVDRLNPDGARRAIDGARHGPERVDPDVSTG